MCDLICDSHHLLFEAAIRVKSIHLIKIMFENQNKRENMEVKDIFT